jgi:hypothetical protein
MRVLLQNCKNHLYYRADGTWTPDADEARDFEKGVEALEFCRMHHPADVQIVLRFSNSAYDIDFPVSDECKQTGKRHRSSDSEQRP